MEDRGIRLVVLLALGGLLFVGVVAAAAVGVISLVHAAAHVLMPSVGACAPGTHGCPKP